MRAENSPSVDLSRPLSVGEVLVSSVRLYGRYPVLFFTLGLIVVAPYELIVLALTNASTLGGKTSATTTLIFALVDLALIGPLISALIVQSVRLSGEGQRPTLLAVLRRGLVVLPVVAAAEIIAGIGIFIGVIAFIIPGLILAGRLAVGAQAAAVERTDWPGALRRSFELTRGEFFHVLAVVVLLTVVNSLLTFAAGAATSGGGHALEVAAVIVIVTISRSFAALGTAVLFFDLVARQRTRPTVRVS